MHSRAPKVADQMAASALDGPQQAPSRNHAGLIKSAHGSTADDALRSTRNHLTRRAFSWKPFGFTRTDRDCRFPAFGSSGRCPESSYVGSLRCTETESGERVAREQGIKPSWGQAVIPTLPAPADVEREGRDARWPK